MPGPSGFYSDAKERLGMTPSAWRDGGRGETIRWTIFDSPLGPMLIAATAKGICRLTFDDSEASLRRLFPNATIVKDDGGLQATWSKARWPRSSSRRQRPTCRSTSPGPLSRKRCGASCARSRRAKPEATPQIAAAIGEPKAVRAVGSANGDNHVAVLIPCHRVIRSDGTLGGYAGGLEQQAQAARGGRASVGCPGTAFGRITACGPSPVRLNHAGPREGYGMQQVTSSGAGQRPLWRRIVDFPLVTMVIAVVIYILAATIGFALGKLVPPTIGKTAVAAVHALITISLLLAAYKLIIARLGAHPKDDLPAGPALRDTAIGAATGFALMTAAVGVAAVVGVYRIVGPGDTSKLLLELIAVAIIPGFTEELLFRGILFRWLEEFGGSWVALAITSALFGLAHIMNPNASWFSSFAIAVEAGVLLGGAYMLTRNLWLAMGMHAGVEFHPGRDFRRAGIGPRRAWPRSGQAQRPAAAVGRQFRARSVGDRAGAGDRGWNCYLVVLAARRGHVVKPFWMRSPDAAPLAERS